MKKKFYVYLLKSLKDKYYYIGQTNNLENRLKLHNQKKVKSTKNRVPFKLVGFEIFLSRKQARWEEYNLKKSAWKRKQFISRINMGAVSSVG